MRTARLIFPAALLLAFTAPSLAKGPDLPPAPFKPLPAGTVLQYSDRVEEVVGDEEFGYRIRFKTESGQNKIISRIGGFLREGEWVYSGRTNWPMKAQVDDTALSAMQFFWPLEVGKEVTATVTETHARSGE